MPEDTHPYLLNETEQGINTPILVVEPRSGIITDANMALLREGIENGSIKPDDILGKPITEFINPEEVDIYALLKDTMRSASHRSEYPTIPVNHPVLGRRIFELRPRKVVDSENVTSRTYHIEFIDRTAELHDGLTNLPNRTFFREELEKELAQAKRYGDPISVAFFDIDHFKAMNDRFGHTNGDIVLQTLADIVQQSMRAADIAGRWGGEEFTLCFTHTPSALALEAIERLRRIMESIESISGDQGIDIPFPTISIGVVSYENPHLILDPAAQAIRYADLAMYAAKQDGRNRAAICHVREDGSVAIFVVAPEGSGYRGTWYTSADRKPKNLQVILNDEQNSPLSVDFDTIDDAANYFDSYKNA